MATAAAAMILSRYVSCNACWVTAPARQEYHVTIISLRPIVSAVDSYYSTPSTDTTNGTWPKPHKPTQETVGRPPSSHPLPPFDRRRQPPFAVVCRDGEKCICWTDAVCWGTCLRKPSAFFASLLSTTRW